MNRRYGAYYRSQNINVLFACSYIGARYSFYCREMRLVVATGAHVRTAVTYTAEAVHTVVPKLCRRPLRYRCIQRVDKPVGNNSRSPQFGDVGKNIDTRRREKHRDGPVGCQNGDLRQINFEHSEIVIYNVTAAPLL